MVPESPGDTLEMLSCRSSSDLLSRIAEGGVGNVCLTSLQLIPDACPLWFGSAGFDSFPVSR